MDKGYSQAFFQNSCRINKDVIIFFSASDNPFTQMRKLMQRQIKDLHIICKGCYYYF